MIAGILTSPVVITKANTPPISASGRFSKMTPDSFTLRNSLYNNKKITTGEVSIPAIIGFISLFGIATRNGMLLISHYNHLQKEEGLNVYDSVIRGSLDRLNPILMTALSSALALIPLALGGDLPGNEIQSPMAKVILGGLLTSTFLNGFIVPIVYLMMHRKKAQESL